jgi:hypothetical protein
MIDLYPEDGGAMGIIAFLFLAIPTIFIVYGITMQLLTH